MQLYGQAWCSYIAVIHFRGKLMRKIVALTVIAAALAVSACNTIAGIGRDVSAAGDAVTSSSNSARR